MAHTRNDDTGRVPAPDDRTDRLERRLRDEAPDAMTPAPASLRSRVLGEIWETTPAAPPALARIGRPALAAAAVLAVTAGAMLALSALVGPSTERAGAHAGEPAMIALLNEARSWGDRLPRLPEGVGVGAEAERALADARRVAQRFGERLTPVRNAFLGGPAESPDAPAPSAEEGVERQPG